MSLLTLNIPTVGVITLPSQLAWTNKYAFTPVKQEIENSLTGAHIVHIGIQQAGRPIALSTSGGGDWVARSTLDALYAALTIAADMTLTLQNGDIFTVIWDHAGPPIEARPILNDIVSPSSSALYAITLRFMTT